MGRKRKPENVDLPPGIVRRRRRYYVVIDVGGRKSTRVAGGSLEAAIALQTQLGALPKVALRECPPNFATYLWQRCRINAKRRGVDCAIAPSDIKAMIDASQGRCAVTGIAFDYGRAQAKRVRPWAPSVDRIDSAGGYTPQNCRLVCAYVNLALNEFGEEMLLAVAAAIRRRRRNFGRTGTDSVCRQFSPTPEKHQ